jgi:hypothetical protein
MRCTVLLGCLLTIPGPALDFLGALPPPCLHYAEAVRAIAGLRLYTGPHERYPAKQAAHDAPGGGRIILPPEQRRVHTASGYAAHYVEATAKLATADFFPVDARLRGTHVQGNLKRAVQWSLQQDDQLERHRDARAQALARELNRLRECSRTIVEAHMPSHALRIAADANVAGLAALIDALDWPHRELARLAVHGAPVWDPIDGGIYRPIQPKLTPAEAARCQANLTAHAEAVRRQVDGRVRRAAVDRHGQFTTAADAVRNCTKKERDKNLLVGPLTWRDVQRLCPEGAIPMPRFAKLELKETGPAFRCIDDGQWVGINNCTRTTETIANPSFVFSAIVARLAAMLLRGAPLPAIRQGLSWRAAFLDQKSAFKTIPTSQPCLVVIALWDPDVPGMRYYYHPGHPFGLTSAVINFAQSPEIVVAAIREICGVPADHYVDDYMLVDPESGGHSAQRCLESLIDALGDGGGRREPRRAQRLDPEKTKPMATRNFGLGVNIDLTTLPERGYVTFTPTDRRRLKVLAQWQEASEHGIGSGAAAHLMGTSGFLLETACARVGRAALLPLVDRQNHPGPTAFTPAMRRSHAFFRALLEGETPRLPPLRIPIVADSKPPILVYSDAAFSWRRKRTRECEAQPQRPREHYLSRDDPLPEPWQFNGELGMMIHDPIDSWTVVASGRPDIDTVQHYMRRERRTYIAQLEGLGMLAPYYTFPQRFAGRRVVHFADNTVAISALVHGYSASVDMADISNAYHLLAAGLRTAAYFDYVPSAANIADLPSRGDFALPRALGADVVEMRVPTHTMLTGPLEAWLEVGEQHGQHYDWPT